MLQSLTGLKGLLNSPAFAGGDQEQSGNFIFGAKIREIVVKGMDQIHVSCGKPVQKAAFTLEGFFDEEDLSSCAGNCSAAGLQPSQAEGKPLQ